ncbi:MAG TPA: gamma-glutamyltransferase family protein, partial [Candidatus Polarisedimenticolia bacterium]|nr:gamma-glutamyltransferase family protein [Candidatus Polarisedimenticolia bacterium]
VPPGKVFRPILRGTHGAVAAGSPLAVEAGMRLLRAGGNAVDAGVAATFAAAVTEFSHFGMGGEASILYYLEAKDRVVAVNADGPAPMLATSEFYVQKGGIPATGILSATVPAAVDGLLLALREDGTKSFAEVIAPAIDYADGFPMSEFLASVIAGRAEAIREWPGAARVFLPGGNPPAAGEIFRQPDLARTLRAMVAAERRAHEKSDGSSRDRRARGIEAVRDYFYRGPVAAAIGQTSEQMGGLMRESDLARYHARLEPAVSTTYKGWEVYKVGFWSQGPVMLQSLNLLEGFDLKGMGLNSTDYVHTVTEAMKLAFADRDRYYGDPAVVTVPSEILLSKEYALRRRALIDPGHASVVIRPGDPADLGMKIGSEKPAAPAAPAGGRSATPPDKTPLGTTCVNVVDAEGNLWSATPSGAWLPSVVAGDTGIPLSQRMQAFSLAAGHPNLVAPGKLPRYTLTPTLARRVGEHPSLAFSTPGLDVQDQTLLQIFLDIAEFGLSLQEAVETPRFDTLHLEETFDQHRIRPGELRIEGRVAGEVIDALKARGHIIEVIGDWRHASAPTIVSIDRRTGVRSAAADPRRDRYAYAY